MQSRLGRCVSRGLASRLQSKRAGHSGYVNSAHEQFAYAALDKPQRHRTGWQKQIFDGLTARNVTNDLRSKWVQELYVGTRQEVPTMVCSRTRILLIHSGHPSYGLPLAPTLRTAQAHQAYVFLEEVAEPTRFRNSPTLYYTLHCGI